MHDPAVAVERRRREPAFVAALVAVVLAVLALVVAAYDLGGGVGPARPAVDAALVTAVLALVVAGLVLRSRLAARRRAHERDLFFATALARMQGAEGFGRTLGAALRGACGFYRARRAAVAVQERATGRAFVWAVPEGAEPGIPAQATALDAAAAGDWLFETEAEGWDAERLASGWRVFVLDGFGRAVEGDAKVPREAVESLAARLAARRLTVAGFGRERDWGGRVVLVDSDVEGPREEALLFAQRLVRDLGGVVQSRFLLGRMRSRIGTMERARVARELHDGTIQSLVGMEMEMDVLRRRADQESLPIAKDLARVRDLLRSEVLELRDTMQRLQPIEIGPDQIVGFLDATVARFGRDSGIRAIFDCEVEDVDLAPRACREIGRILQEALQNVRKHSGAQRVLVRFGRAPSGWRLVVDDDGQGFPFEGTLENAERDDRKGPHVIKERVRALGGELTIFTGPGAGARLDILLPQEVR